MNPSNTARAPAALCPGTVFALHLSMYRRFVTGDDEAGRPAREPERVTERSEP
jgi:hypothetical protein